MREISFFLGVICIAIFYSCEMQDDQNLGGCDKLSNREEAEAVRLSIQNNKITDSLNIINALIGEWRLMGVMSAWVEDEVGPDCINLKITPNEIEIHDSDSGFSIYKDWELTPIEVNGNSKYVLNANEDFLFKRLGMEVFSDSIMYGTGRIEDGHTYFYKKID